MPDYELLYYEGFESGIQRWDTYGEFTTTQAVSTDWSEQGSYSLELEVSNFGGFRSAFHRPSYNAPFTPTLSAGTNYRMTAAIRIGANSTETNAWQIRPQWRQSDDTFISNGTTADTGSSPTVGQTYYLSVDQVSPALTGTALISVFINNGASATAHAYVDEVYIYDLDSLLTEVRVVHFRKRGDANTLNSSTWDDDSGLDTDYTMGVDEPFRLRVGSEEFNGGNDSGNLSLQYSHNSGAWTTVPTSSGSDPIYSALSTQFADGAATTQLFTGYASTWQAGEGDEQSNSAPGHDVQKATETEFALAIDSTQVANNDTIDLRLVSSTPPDVYGSQDCGTITVSEGEPTYIYYRTQPISGTIDSATGLTREIRLRRD